MRKLTDKQGALLEMLQRGYKIMFGRVGGSQSLTTISMRWGDYLVSPKGQKSTLDNRVLGGLVKKGYLEEVARVTTPIDPDADPVAVILASQDKPRETHRLTTLGKEYKT